MATVFFRIIRADFPKGPLLARTPALASNLDELLFSLIERTVISQAD